MTYNHPPTPPFTSSPTLHTIPRSPPLFEGYFFSMLAVASVLAVLCASLVAAQDPAPGWMGYAKAVHPTNASAKLTHMEAKWQVPPNPRRGGAFFSPWFGIESSDNLNLFQPVNPWTGSNWLFYIEYFQWQPENNEDSTMKNIKPGDVLHGVVDYVASSDSYHATHTNLNTGEMISMTIPVQSGREYTIGCKKARDVVFEKSQFSCDQYPPSGQVLFWDIMMRYDNEMVSPSWTTGYVDDNCNNRAHVVNETSIEITWNTN